MNENIITMEADQSVVPGAPVMVTSSGKVSAATGAFCGVCVGARNGYAAVQISGYVRLPYYSAPTVGYCRLAAYHGLITPHTNSGREYLVLDISPDKEMVGFLL